MSLTSVQIIIHAHENKREDATKSQICSGQVADSLSRRLRSKQGTDTDAGLNWMSPKSGHHEQPKFTLSHSPSINAKDFTSTKYLSSRENKSTAFAYHSQ